MNEEDILRKKLDRINQNSHYGIMVDTEITKIVRSHIKRLEDNKMNATSVQNIKNVKDVCFDISNDPIEMKSKFTIVASTNDDIFAFEFEGEDLLQSCKRAGLFTGWEKDQRINELEKKLSEWKKEAAECLKLRDEAQKEAYKLKKENEREEPSSRRDILHAAEKCVCGQREQDYGTPESNFQLIADLWNDYLKKEQSSIVVDAMDVAMMMALLKIARIKNGGGSGDSFIDLAGYAACGGEIWASKRYQKDLN